jgi:hypothetical protein
LLKAAELIAAHLGDKDEPNEQRKRETMVVALLIAEGLRELRTMGAAVRGLLGR